MIPSFKAIAALSDLDTGVADVAIFDLDAATEQAASLVKEQEGAAFFSASKTCQRSFSVCANILTDDRASHSELVVAG